MAKKSFKLEDVEFALTKNQIEAEKAKALLTDLQAMLEEEATDKAEKTEYTYVGLILSGEGYENLPLNERAIYTLKLEEGQDHNNIADWITTVAKKHNANKRAVKKSGLCERVSDVIHNAAYKNKKEEGLKFATNPAPLLLVEIENELKLS